MNTDKIKDYSSHGSGEFKISDFRSAGKNIIFEKGVLAFHPENITLGNNIYIGHNTILKAYYKNQMQIGDNTWIGQNCFFHSAGNISIGKAVGIGPHVKILTSVHEDGDIETPVLYHPLSFKSVEIGDGSDIGTAAMIMPGVKIGEGAIVGAGSVVTKDVPAYAVVAGVPAKILRHRK